VPTELTPEELARLKLADPDDLKFSIAHGLRFNGRKRVHYADNQMADIAADHLLQHLEASGYVILRKPPAPREPDRFYGPGFDKP
jgi:hypothetical protein